MKDSYKPCVYIDTEQHPTVGIGFNLDRSDARRHLSAVGANYDQIRTGSATLTDYQIRTLFKLILTWQMLLAVHLLGFIKSGEGRKQLCRDRIMRRLSMR